MGNARNIRNTINLGADKALDPGSSDQLKRIDRSVWGLLQLKNKSAIDRLQKNIFRENPGQLKFFLDPVSKTVENSQLFCRNALDRPWGAGAEDRLCMVLEGATGSGQVVDRTAAERLQLIGGSGRGLQLADRRRRIQGRAQGQPVAPGRDVPWLVRRGEGKSVCPPRPAQHGFTWLLGEGWLSDFVRPGATRISRLEAEG